MRDFNLLRHPSLAVSINGAAVEKRPSRFLLATDAAFHTVRAGISFPADAETGRIGDAVSVSLSEDGVESLLFTGSVTHAGRNGAYRCLPLSDGCLKLGATAVNPAYRKEKARVILQDTLDAAGIGDAAVTCPDQEIARFSTDWISGAVCLDLLVRALAEYNHAGLRWFFDAADTFRFGTADDSGRNEGARFAFETGKSVYEAGLDAVGRWISVPPLPIRHSQAFALDGAEMVSVRTDLFVSARKSRLIIWYKAAV
jgi:hypothetical protein